MGRFNLQVKDHDWLQELDPWLRTSNFLQHPYGCAPWIPLRFNRKFYWDILRHLRENFPHKRLKLRCYDIWVLQLCSGPVHCVDYALGLRPHHHSGQSPPTPLTRLTSPHRNSKKFKLNSRCFDRRFGACCRTWPPGSITVLVGALAAAYRSTKTLFKWGWWQIEMTCCVCFLHIDTLWTCWSNLIHQTWRYTAPSTLHIGSWRTHMPLSQTSRCLLWMFFLEHLRMLQ